MRKEIEVYVHKTLRAKLHMQLLIQHPLCDENMSTMAIVVILTKIVSPRDGFSVQYLLVVLYQY